MIEPRFIVRESHGYRIPPTGRPAGGTKERTEVLKPLIHTGFRWPLAKSRAYAADLAARLNAEDAAQ